MPIIPKYQGGVTSRDVTPFRGTANATGASFGAGQARDIGSLAQSLQRFGTAALDASLKNEGRLRKAQAREALVSAQKDGDLYLFGDGTSRGAFAKRGNETANLVTESSQALGAIKKKYLERMGDDATKELFSASFDSYTASNVRSVNRYRSQEIEQYERDSLDAHNKQLLSNAVKNRYNPDTVLEARDDTLANVAQKYRGASPEQVKQKQDEAVNNFHSNVIAAMAEDTPRAAKGYLEANWDEFDPVAREKMKSKIDSMIDDEWVREKAISLGGLSLEKQLAEVDKIKDAGQAKQVRRLVKDRHNELRETTAIRQKETLEKEVDSLFKTPTAYVVPLGLPAKDQEHLYSLQQRILRDQRSAKGVGATPKTAPKTYYDLTRMSFDTFKNVNLLEFADKLSPGDFKKFADMQKNDKDYQNTQSLAAYTNQLVKATADDNFEEATFVRELFETEINKYPAEERDRVETWNKIKDQFLMEMDIKGSWFDSPYWKAKYKGDEIEEPDFRPEPIPTEAKWVDQGTDYRGYEFTGPEGDVLLYSMDGNTYKVNRK